MQVPIVADRFSCAVFLVGVWTPQDSNPNGSDTLNKWQWYSQSVSWWFSITTDYLVRCLDLIKENPTSFKRVVLVPFFLPFNRRTLSSLASWNGKTRREGMTGFWVSCNHGGSVDRWVDLLFYWRLIICPKKCRIQNSYRLSIAKIALPK